MVTAPQARQKDAVAFGSETHARSPQAPHSFRSCSANHLSISTFDKGCAMTVDRVGRVPPGGMGRSARLAESRVLVDYLRIAVRVRSVRPRRPWRGKRIHEAGRAATRGPPV